MILNVTSITPFGGVVEVRPHVKVDVAVPGRDGGSLCSAQALCQTCEQVLGPIHETLSGANLDAEAHLLAAHV